MDFIRTLFGNKKAKVSVQAPEELRQKRLILEHHFGHSNAQQLRVIAEAIVGQLRERYESLIDPEAKMEVIMCLEDSSVTLIVLTKPISVEKSTEIMRFVSQCASRYK
jgi:hypothetical protein